MSEVLPTWNNDLLSFLASPEELLYDNPIGLAGATEECALPGALKRAGGFRRPWLS